MQIPLFTLEQLDHALEWQIKQLIITAGHWPDVAALLAAGASDEDFEAAKQAIRDTGRELVEVFGPGAWQDRGEMRDNNIVVTRLMPEAGSYGYAQPVNLRALDEQDLSQGYARELLPDGPQTVNYDIRYIANDMRMDRLATNWMMQAFGSRRYVRGLNDDLTRTTAGFLLVPAGSPRDLSSDTFIERMWRVQVLDVHLVSPEQLGAVPAATDLSISVEAAENPEK